MANLAALQMTRFLYSFATALAVWLVLWLTLIGPRLLWQPTLDVQMHNTYFVVGSYASQLCSFLLLLLFTLLLRFIRRQVAKSATVALACSVGSALLLFRWAMLSYFHPASWLLQTAQATTPAVSRLVKAGWVVQAFLLGVVIWSGITFWRLYRSR
ncbi:hypothetical protein MUN84_10185 [Hymenobacter sp. 5516J-16]|uniref:hypothetical protein n=1 Tax=Hymenobacter sp. 5516J-16 TaxID=2932253 RepID=UPI001FD55FAE|nr:hypothetical protein [Hymenobacter sp. 5516J-16]UOQ78858.1 hypothetical protein MUN84_10185 [Hymenobacter sp. 5516J-16]